MTTSSVRFSVAIPGDDSALEKLDVMSGIELIFDDDRIYIPEKYYKLCQSIQPGDTVEISIAVTKPSK